MSENAHTSNFVMYVGGLFCMCNNGRQIVCKGREAVLCLLYSGGFYKNHKVGNNRFFRQLNFWNIGMSSSPHSVGLPSRPMLWTSARLVEATETHQVLSRIDFEEMLQRITRRNWMSSWQQCCPSVVLCRAIQEIFQTWQQPSCLLSTQTHSLKTRGFDSQSLDEMM